VDIPPAAVLDGRRSHGSWCPRGLRVVEHTGCITHHCHTKASPGLQRALCRFAIRSCGFDLSGCTWGLLIRGCGIHESQRVHKGVPREEDEDLAEPDVLAGVRFHHSIRQPRVVLRHKHGGRRPLSASPFLQPQHGGGGTEHDIEDAGKLAHDEHGLQLVAGHATPRGTESKLLHTRMHRLVVGVCADATGIKC